jgi:hypothetical protein
MTHGNRIAAQPYSTLAGAAGGSDEKRFKAHDDGSFKILAISDLHYTPVPDPNGLELTEKLIAAEKPDLVIATGDNVSGDSCATEADVRAAVGNVAAAMEKAQVPWAITLGNHDQEHFERTHISRESVFQYYESYPHNMNGGWVRHIHGAGNKHLLIWDAGGTKPIFALWLVDSGPKSSDPEVRYDWIHADQVNWYCQTSNDLENHYGEKVPGLMYFHIPLLEFQQMILTRKVIGERHEPESPSTINGGLFAAVFDRGDVRGIFCGHDHVNNYVGKYHGVTLGYNGVVGFHGYPHTPPDDPTNGRARGGRAMTISATEPGKFRTWMCFRDGSTDWEHLSDAYERDQIK